MLDLSLAHPVKGGDSLGLLPLGGLDEAGEVFGNGRKVERVESYVTDHGSVKVNGPGKEGQGLRTLVLIDHRIPEALGHFIEGGSGPVRALGGEGGGRTGEEGSDGELHFQSDVR